MNKIGEIHRGNASISTGIVVGGIGTFLVCWLSMILLGLDIPEYLQKDKIWEVLLIIPTMLLSFVIHEYIHVGFFLLFGRGKARIKVSREKSVGAVVIHQVNEKVYYKRWEMLVILLSPLVILTSGFLLMFPLISMPFLLFANIALNAMGSSIDMYVSFQLLTKHHSRVKINFDALTIKMNIYE
ncbi:DUF3267 domain-containing protein [Brevibacillus sp. NPDC058079]|uniref:DUF3267 domain-containing protein n=1 Tax=Brevibacillus sp. NPDC058079 TaxID=3346330 RepID=UPI0036E026D5